MLTGNCRLRNYNRSYVLGISIKRFKKKICKRWDFVCGSVEKWLERVEPNWDCVTNNRWAYDMYHLQCDFDYVNEYIAENSDNLQNNFGFEFINKELIESEQGAPSFVPLEKNSKILFFYV